MRIRDLLGVVVLLVVLAGGAGFMSWYWQGTDLRAWLDRAGLGTGSIPSTESLTLAGVDATPTPRATPTAQPALAPYCAPGQSPRFALGFADLKQQVGAPMGDPIECEHPNPDNGDSLQKTTTGLAVFRKADRQLSFTNGWDHWAITPQGLVHWQGDEVPEAARGG